MTDSATRQIVQQIVVGYVTNGTMFTAYDVTLEARSQGARLRHAEGRDVVHEMFQNGIMGASYKRTVVDVGAPTKPFVYHRFNDDPQQYSSPSNSATAQTPPPSPPTSNQGGGFVSRLVGSLLGRGGNQTSQQTSPTNTRPRRHTQLSPKTLALANDTFLPISRQELAKGLKSTSFWSTPWFGRRDLIPPADDKRTRLIDRAMVSAGLLTPAELAEIHEIGALMDYYRPSLLHRQAVARQAGNSAVEQDRQLRAAEKEKRKQEAAERKAAREAAIRQRRQTDIIFLGLGVSQELHQRAGEPERLERSGLPLIDSPQQLAERLEITVPQLRWLAFHNDVATRVHYVRFEIPKKSGGMRTLHAPHQELARCQNWILREILNKLPVETCAHGFVQSRSILTNAQQHVEKPVLINVDLEDFFPSVTFPRVRFIFKQLGYSPCIATVLALLCTEAPRRAVTYNGQRYLVATGARSLPQGACTSPAISNQAAIRLDRRLNGLAEQFGATYTRYADDMTFSGGEDLERRTGYAMAHIRHIIDDCGFRVNLKKCRVLRDSAQQNVTGLIVNQRPSVSRRKLRQLRAVLHNARKTGLRAQNREGHPNFRAHLEGYFTFVAMTRPELGKALAKQLAEISDEAAT